MIVTTVTGATPRDYFALEAETVSECAQLVRVSQSEFVPKGTMRLCTPEDGLELHIYFGESRTTKLDAQTRDAIDTTA